MVNYFVLIVIALAGWGHLFPDDALAVMHELKRQLRMRMLERIKQDSAKELERSLHERAARQGINANLVDQVFTEHRGVIMSRLGTIFDDQVLSDPDDPGDWN